MAKIKVGLIFGGISGEHEVSLVSGRSIYDALDKKKYDVKLIGIDKDGNWHLGKEKEIWLGKRGVGNLRLNTKTRIVTAVREKGKVFLIDLKNGQKLANIDVFFPITHGTFGEDGCLQGFLEILDVAYVGPGVLGSAVGMDKDLMKRVLRDAKVNIAKFYVVRKKDVNPANISLIIEDLKFPIFVKPCNLGSSVGISKANNTRELSRAIDFAFRFDHKALIEEFIKGREIECSVLGNEHPIASIPGEIKLKPGHFYSYEAKYVDEELATPVPCADLPKKFIKKIQETAVKVFKILGCEGMGRVDFFLTSKGKLYVNEINTLPGFTVFSMYPKMFEHSGISYPKLLDELIKYGVERKKRSDKLIRNYDT
jgi:D-alanine-D-alanine ligase